MRRIKKRLDFLMISTSSINMQSLGGGDRTTRAGCRCESVMFVTMFCLSRSQAGALFVRGDIVQTGVSLPFIGLFQRGFMFFFQMGLLLYSSLFVVR